MLLCHFVICCYSSANSNAVVNYVFATFLDFAASHSPCFFTTANVTPSTCKVKNTKQYLKKQKYNRSQTIGGNSDNKLEPTMGLMLDLYGRMPISQVECGEDHEAEKGVILVQHISASLGRPKHARLFRKLISYRIFQIENIRCAAKRKQFVSREITAQQIFYY